MLRAAAIAAAAAAGYVLMRAAWIFVGLPGVAGVLLALCVLAAWRRPLAAGAAAGAALSALAVAL